MAKIWLLRKIAAGSHLNTVLVFPTGTPGRSSLHEVMQEALGGETDKGGSQYKMHSGAGYCCGRPLENG